MAEPAPTLIFVSGPQCDRRIGLSGPAAVLGRHPDCEVRVTEQYASRQHVRLERTADGWVMENLSPTGTWVNGKKFKGKKVLLDTGDVLGVGSQTEVLFVSGEDDPDAALDEYRREHPVLVPVEEAGGAEAGGVAGGAEAGAAAAPAGAQPAVAEQPSAAQRLDEEQRRRKARLKKYLVMGAAYLGGLTALVVVLSLVADKRPRGPGGGAPPKLTDKDIHNALRAPIRIDGPANPQIAAHHLETARAKARLGLGAEDWQKAVLHFKLHLAYLKQADFEQPTDALAYDEKLRHLEQFVQKRYRQAWVREQSRKWAEAKEIWDGLLLVIGPEERWDTKPYRRLHKNIRRHAGYVRRFIKED
jgi:hypothetical protein